MGAFAALNRQVLDLLFPRRCLGCGIEGRWICPACAASLAVVSRERMVSGTRVTSLLDFEVPLVREMLHALKYEGIREVATELGSRLRSHEIPGLEDAILIPVPLSRARLKTRGYNQAEELARVLGILLGLPVWPDALNRTGRSASQVGRGADERKAREKGFAWGGVVPAGYAERPWVVVDDLLTTGATLADCFAQLAPYAKGGLTGLTLAAKA